FVEGDVPGAADSVPSQLDMVQDLVTPNDLQQGPARKIDALLVSVGGNDINFAGIAMDLVANGAPDDVKKAVTDWTGMTFRTQAQLDSDLAAHLAALDAKFQALADGVQEKLQPTRVFLTQYFDPGTDATGHTAAKTLDDI